NTMWDKETFAGLCGTGTPQAQIDALWAAFSARRTPGLTSTPPVIGPTVFHQATGTDRPFIGLGVGNYAGGSTGPSATNTGLANTLLGPSDLNNPNSPRLFAVSGSDLQTQMSLMTKIYNNATVRSNVFAVWATVGFFEVKDETTRPVMLGAEIGRAEN